MPAPHALIALIALPSLPLSPVTGAGPPSHPGSPTPALTTSHSPPATCHSPSESVHYPSKPCNPCSKCHPPSCSSSPASSPASRCSLLSAHAFIIALPPLHRLLALLEFLALRPFPVPRPRSLPFPLSLLTSLPSHLPTTHFSARCPLPFRSPPSQPQPSCRPAEKSAETVSHPHPMPAAGHPPPDGAKPCIPRRHDQR